MKGEGLSIQRSCNFCCQSRLVAIELAIKQAGCHLIMLQRCNDGNDTLSLSRYGKLESEQKR